MNRTALLDRFKPSFEKFWVSRNARERAYLITAAAAASLGLYYALLISPALNGREQLNKNLPVLRQQIAQLQVLSKEALTLSKQTSAPLMTMSKENIEAGLVRNGLKPQSVVLTGDYAKVQLDAVSFAGMMEWLDEMQRTALISAVDANIVVMPSPDKVNVTITLRQQKND